MLKKQILIIAACSAILTAGCANSSGTTFNESNAISAVSTTEFEKSESNLANHEIKTNNEITPGKEVTPENYEEVTGLPYVEGAIDDWGLYTYEEDGVMHYSRSDPRWLDQPDRYQKSQVHETVQERTKRTGITDTELMERTFLTADSGTTQVCKKGIWQKEVTLTEDDIAKIKDMAEWGNIEKASEEDFVLSFYVPGEQVGQNDVSKTILYDKDGNKVLQITITDDNPCLTYILNIDETNNDYRMHETAMPNYARVILGIENDHGMIHTDA